MAACVLPFQTQIYRKLKSANKTIDEVQKSLSDYLNSKRASFSRFYFLSDQELLEILSKVQDPTAVQPHLKKCFNNMAAVEFTRSTTICAMLSNAKERVLFKVAREEKKA